MSDGATRWNSAVGQEGEAEPAPDVVGLPLAEARQLLEGWPVRVVRTAPPQRSLGRGGAWGEERVIRQQEIPGSGVTLTVAREMLSEDSDILLEEEEQSR